MMNIFPYRVLYVDLSSKKVWSEDINREDVKDFIGSRGFNAKILWDLTNKNTDPLSGENPLIIGAGTLTGTHAPSSGRVTVTCLSPTTGLYCKSSSGGHWGSVLKLAGYISLVVLGKSDKPVYIYINDDEVEIRDASHLWGKDVRETDELIRQHFKDESIQIASIGPAGENLVSFAAVMFNIYNAAARAGTGTVMGSKMLKAVVVKGSKPITVDDTPKFNELAVGLRHKLSEDTGSKRLSNFGTGGIINMVNTIHALPSYNYQESYIENAHMISGEHLTEGGFLKRKSGCGACGTGCHRYSEVDEGPYKGSYGGGPEFETLSALGSGCGILDMSAILKGNELCNIYGMDTISAGSVVQWAMECVQKGVLSFKDIDGIRLEFGNADAMINMLTKIAFREGFGDVLAEGVKRASEKVGGESWKWAVQAKGLEQSRVEIRLRKGYSLAFAANNRGPDHLHTECVAESARTPEGKALIKKICGDEKYASPYLTEKRAEIVRWHEDCYAITDALGICAFATTLAYAIGPSEMAELFQAATGIEIDEETIMECGRRIVTLEKCINVRRDADRSLDTLPYRIMNEPIKTGPMKGMKVSAEELDIMLDEYYEMHGWSKETSWPKADTLESLGLKSVSGELKKLHYNI